MDKLGLKFKETEPYIIEMRRWFHAHPELSLQEKETSARIREELEKMGISVERLEPNYGLIGTIEGKAKGKTIMVRADIDALPVKEETGLEFASKNEGCMHACGHDAHIAMLLGVAKVLSEMKDELNGTVKLLFQVAEETGHGVQEVLEYIERTGGVDQIIGQHIWSTLPEGEVLLIPDAVFAGAEPFEFKIHGQGGHGARPDLAKDPIKALCDLVLQVSSIPTNYYDVLDHSVVSVGKISAGTMGNILPSEAYATGSIRYYKPGGGEIIKELVRRKCEGVGIIHDVEVECVLDGGIPPVINNHEMIERARTLVKDVDGLICSPQSEPISASDNYGVLIERYPGFYAILGAGSKDHYNYPQHHCKFDLVESSFRKGAEFMARYVTDFLK